MLLKHPDYLFEDTVCERGNHIFLRGKKKGGNVSILFKCLRADCSNNKNIKCLENEFEILGKFHSANIVNVYEFVLSEGSAFIVMEDVYSKLLSQYIQEGRHSLKRIDKYCNAIGKKCS